jgi:hypothetical protein
MARETDAQAAALWTWSAVAAGAIAALIIQAILTMLALGVGLLAVDLPTANAAPVAISTAALLWWIFSGIFAAFAGGAVAGAYAPVTDERSRSVHGVAAWAVATLIIIGASALSSSAVVSGMSGPGYNVTTRVVAVTRPGAPALSAAQTEQLRKAFAATMLASVVGLLAGAVAAGAGGWYGREMAEEMSIPAGRRRAA